MKSRGGVTCWRSRTRAPYGVLRFKIVLNRSVALRGCASEPKGQGKPFGIVTCTPFADHCLWGVQAALEMVTAAHQLESAIRVLGLCTRPLLLAGLPPDAEDGEPLAAADRAAAGEVLAKAMLELLPAIDANDVNKTTMAMHFFVAVLSSIPSLEVDRLSCSISWVMYLNFWGLKIENAFGVFISLGPPEQIVPLLPGPLFP